MDVEKGVRERLGHGPVTSRLLTMMPILVSCVALAGMVVLFVQNQQIQTNVKELSSPKKVSIPDAARQERALKEVRI